MHRVGVIGASGYAGGEIIRILVRHPDVELAYLSSDTYAGKPLSEAFRSLLGAVLPVCEKYDLSIAAEKTDILFIAQHNGWAMENVPAMLDAGLRVIDLGADFRFSEPSIYEEWYEIPHKAPGLCSSAVYGLPELYREKIAKASLIANPGCYPTGVVLALAPLLSKGIIEPNTIIIDAKSGVSGAGRSKPDPALLYSEVNENLKPYNIGVHRHTPEIEQQLSVIAGIEVRITFTPHLVPMTRGILASCYASLTEDISTSEALKLLRDFYGNSGSIFVLPENEYPQTKNVAGSNQCHIGCKVDSRTNRIIIVSAIDNLVKGAAGQAIQNMNLMLGLDEHQGLESPSLYP